MGTDTHFYVEKRADENSSWESADDWGQARFGGPGEIEVVYEKRFYTGRNYDLFAILADVRNGRGFAGVVTGEGFVPIDDPRGLPDDVSNAVRRESSDYGNDGHSHSYFTVAELLTYDWTQKTGRRGTVDLDQLIQWGTYGEPRSWSRAVSGGMIVNLDGATSFAKIKAAFEKHNEGKSRDDMLWYDSLRALEYRSLRGGDVPERLRPAYDLARQALGMQEGQIPVFDVRWGVIYHEAASEFLAHTMPKLWRVGSPENVRIVFWFDN